MVHRRRSSSVVSNIALNIPVLHFENDQSNQEPQKRKPRRSSFDLNIGKLSLEDDERIKSAIDPLNRSEKQSIWGKIQEPYRYFMDISFEDYCLLEDNHEYEDQFLNQIEYNQIQNNKFILDLNSIIGDLDHFFDVNEDVTRETSEFKTKSNDLIKDLEKIQHLHDGLTDRLRVLESLDSIVQNLSKSNSTRSVTKSSFREEILLKLDEAMIFVNDPKYANYKEIEVFKYRFEQCLIRALSMIRNYVIKTIKNIENDTIESIKGLDSAVVINSIINNKFSESMTIIYSPFFELYKRSFGDDDDISNLLEDVYNQYQTTRLKLVKSYIIDPYLKNVDFTDPVNKLTQSVLSFYAGLLGKELEIYEKAFFLPPTELLDGLNNDSNMIQMHRFFESILESMYYSLRNKIIRENDIDTLCDLINIIQSYFIDEQAGDEENTNNLTFYPKPNFEILFKPLLEDVQTRLVFRVQIYLEANIVNYKKTGRELIIENRKEKADTTLTDDQIVKNLEFVESSKMVYPPIIKAIKLLTKIYTLVKPQVFDELAGSIVHLCILSLRNNYGQPDSVDLNAKLYQMESLLWFKNNINMFDIEFVQRDVNLDFSGLKNLFNRFTVRSTTLTSDEHETMFNAIWGSIPSVVNDISDCRIELQIELRNTVHEFIELTSKNFTREIQEILISGQEIQSNTVKSAVGQLQTAIDDYLPRLKTRVFEFISDERIFEFLLDGIQNVIVKQYSEFYDLVLSRDDTLVTELLELDELNRLWAEAVKQLFVAADKDANVEPESDVELDLSE